MDQKPFVETAIDFSLTLTEKKERAAVFTDRGLMIKYKNYFLKLFGVLSKKNMCRYLKKHWPLYCNFSPDIYVNRDFHLSPQLA